VIVSLVVVAATGADPRRSRNPYRGVPAAAELRRDLPAGRADPAGAVRDLARAGVLLAALAFWARRLSRVPAEPPEAATGAPAREALWREAVGFQAGAWLTLAATATALTALTALTGG
jgi:hypothetical protein